MFKRFKKLGILLIAILVAVSLVGCGGAKEAEKESKEGSAEAKKLKVGYVVNFMSHEWYQNIIKGAQARAEEVGVELEVADANNDSAKQVTQAENLIAKGVDVLVLTPVDAKALVPVVKMAKEAGIPVVTESNIVEGATTYVGIDNKTAGRNAGLWLAEDAKKKGYTPKALVVGLPALADCRARVEGFKAGLEESGIEYKILQEVDGQGSKEKAYKASQDALTANPDVNVIFGINDDSATGGMSAYKAAGLDESKLVAVGFGFEGAVGQNALLGDTPYKAAAAMFPNFVGVSLIDAAVAIDKGEKLPEHYETPTMIIKKDNFDQFYTKDGDKYQMNFDAIRELMKK